MKSNSIIKEKSFKFAVRTIRLYQFLINDKKEYVLSKQLLRSGTSIGANINEALQGSSKKDLINKLNISLKEAKEKEYWISLLKETDYLSDNQATSILEDCVELIKILVALIKSSKSNIQNTEKFK